LSREIFDANFLEKDLAKLRSNTYAVRVNNTIDTNSDLRDLIAVSPEELNERHHHDSSDDGQALASAGMGTDEDYGIEDRYLDSYWEDSCEIGCDF